MLRHDAFGNLDVTAEKDAGEEIPGMQFPVPVVGPYSPSVLALRMLAKSSLLFGGYLVALRLICLVNPDLARFGVNVIATVFAIALVVHWFAPGRGMPEWPVWAGVAVLVLFGAESFLPGLGALTGVPGQGSLSDLIPPLLQAAILVLVLVHFLLPAVKQTTSRFSRGPLVLGLIAAFEGGKFATGAYFPESDFSAWGFFAFMVLWSVPASILVADQYARFQEAMNPKWDAPERPGVPKWLRDASFKYSTLTPFGLIAALWLGNLTFLTHLGWAGASVTGILAFLGSLAVWALLRGTGDLLRPYRAAWAAVSFFLTYNLQRVSNPNVYRLTFALREPLVRLAVVSFTSATLGLGLLHLSGVQARPGRNHGRPVEIPLWNYVLPQSYPELFNKEQLDEPARGVYRRYAGKLATEGDAPMPTATPVRSLAGLAFRSVLLIAGGPALFFFLLATTQGHFLASKEETLGGV